jgi:hypothetical protein
MKVIYTEAAREDRGETISYLERNYPTVISEFDLKARRPSLNGQECAEYRSFATPYKVSIG